MRTFRSSWLPCCFWKKKKKTNSLCPQKYEHIKWDLSPMQPCTIIQVSSSRSCMACKYTFNREKKKKEKKSVKPLKLFHIRFSDVLVLVMCDSTAAVVKMHLLENKPFVCDHACWTVTFIGQDFFPPLSAFYMHSQTTLGNDHKAMWLTEGGDFTTWTQQHFCGFVFPKSHLFCGSCLI